MIIELQNISKHYQNGEGDKQEVLKDISLKVPAGGSLAIVGPSGSGKSTLLNIIGTLDKPDSGILKFKGSDPASLNENQLADLRNQEIGFVFQMHLLLPQLTLLENVLLPVLTKKGKHIMKEAEKRANELLDFVGLSGHINKKPGQLSGGECQRAAVVRALINNPYVILADEPTGSLDHDSATQVGELLCKINDKQNIAIVLVTHSLDLAKKMRNIYKLDNGILKLLSD